jgi:hypothetical protein
MIMNLDDAFPSPGTALVRDWHSGHKTHMRIRSDNSSSRAAFFDFGIGYLPLEIMTGLAARS